MRTSNTIPLVIAILIVLSLGAARVVTAAISVDESELVLSQRSQTLKQKYQEGWERKRQGTPLITPRKMAPLPTSAVPDSHEASKQAHRQGHAQQTSHFPWGLFFLFGVVVTALIVFYRNRSVRGHKP